MSNSDDAAISGTESRLDEDTVEHVSIIEYNEKAAEFDKQPGERVILNGCRRTANVHDDERGCFEQIGEAVAIIELHQPIPESEVTDWCNSSAGKLALAHWFDHTDPEEVVMT